MLSHSLIILLFDFAFGGEDPLHSIIFAWEIYELFDLNPESLIFSAMLLSAFSHFFFFIYSKVEGWCFFTTKSNYTSDVFHFDVKRFCLFWFVIANVFNHWMHSRAPVKCYSIETFCCCCNKLKRLTLVWLSFEAIFPSKLV